MTHNTTEAVATGELRHLDPTGLVIDANIRTEAQATLTSEFIDSVREGVRQPVLAVEIDGQVRVRDGQRRTLAAREAGLVSVPVYVVPVAADADDKALTVDRILEQLASFEREELRASDRVAAIEQLALAGMSATKIAKATRTKKKDIDHTLTVAKSATTLDLLDQGAGLTLEQSATLAAYDHDPEAQQWLITAAHSGRFEFQAKVLAEADERPALLAQVADYAAEGIAAVTRQPSYNQARRLDRLETADGAAARIEDVPVKNRLAYVWADDTESWTDAEGNEVPEHVIDFDLLDSDEDDEDSPADDQPEDGLLDPRTLTRHINREVETTWYVLGSDDLGLTERAYSYSTTSSAATSGEEDSAAEKEAQKQERRRVRVLNAASVTAREVRIEKLTAWLARKTLPKASAPKVATFIATSMHAHHDMFGANSMQGNAAEIAATILGGQPAELLEQATTADRAQIIGLGIALASREAHMWKDAWRNVGDRNYLGGSYTRARADYLRFLVEVTGYTLSDVEQVIAGDTDAADVPLD
ncbi:ParB/Srx family N-terminal domain-containing protein [Gordonia sp. C13]|uniref:ParB/Srx family N-terminal domain-containing protein n=1 Tax=Gordonia sp. C13 TaxID=2935078 RepID=UPI00200B3410|nr:ParB/Srx family N-terminal domain-containing protein [Gordonia sp. C13]MCK8615262.1 ParB/Srx family N-terminal domain-containing protein [Gordonia sp. C13]